MLSHVINMEQHSLHQCDKLHPFKIHQQPFHTHPKSPLELLILYRCGYHQSYTSKRYYGSSL